MPEFPPPGQKADLDRQLARLAEFSAQHGFRVVEAVRETGSGWNDRRKALLRIFRNPNVQVIVVEHRDGLMRFGLEYAEAALAAEDRRVRRVVVIDAAERIDDIVHDLPMK
jgi:putative resolvase